MTESADADADVDFRALADLGSDLVFRLDRNGRVGYVSGPTVRYFGRRQAEVVGGHFTALLHEEALPGVTTAVERVLDGEPVEGLEFEPAVDSGVQVARFDIEPVVEAGTVVGARGVATDVTERRRRDQVVEVLDRVLRHNLRNTMNVVLGEAARLQVETEDPVAAEAGERITSASEDLLGLSDAARDLRRVVVDGYRFDPVDPAAVARSTCEGLVRAYPRAEIRLEVAVDPDARVPDTGFEVAVRELVENALEHAGHGAPTVTVTVAHPAADTVRVSVADDGPGLPEMEQRVLEAGGEQPLRHGQGLGLWLVNWIVGEAGGELHLDVEPGEGTTVTVDLPRADADTSDVRADAGTDTDD